MESTKNRTFDSTAASFGGCALAAAAGWALAGKSLAGAAAFADVSLAGGLSVIGSAAMLVGSVFRSVAAGTVGRNFVHIAAMLVATIAKAFMEPKNDPKLCGAATATGTVVSGFAVSIAVGDGLQKLVFYLFYGALSGFSAFSIALLASGLKRKRAIDLAPPYGCAYAVAYIMAIAALCSIGTPFLNVGLAVGAAVTLGGAYFYRHTGGVLCGALTTCGAFLASARGGATVILLPAAGLLAGYLYRKKPAVAAGAFAGICFLLTALTGATSGAVAEIADVIVGAGIFTLAAPYYSDRWIVVSDDGAAALPEIFSSRMNFLSDSIGAVRRETERIGEAFSERRGLEDPADEAAEEVCKRCYRRLACWNSNREETESGFRRLAELGEFAREGFPAELSDCLRKDELKESFRKSARERATMKLLDMRSAESRRLLTEQLRIIEEMIGSAAERSDVRYSEAASRTIREKLEKFGYSPSNVIAYYNSGNRLLAELYFSAKDVPKNCGRICDLVSDELRLPMGSAAPADSGRETRIRLFEKPEYSLEVYGAALSADGAKENGDASTTFTDGVGAAYVILSDGMGSGKEAAVESRLVVRMFKRLVTCGADCDSAIKLINSIMYSKSGDETFATLDALRVDLDSCALTIMKSGAAATIVRRRGEVVKISQPTFPIGAYERSETYFKRFDFEEGDIAIMFSDGVGENEYRFIRELLLTDSDLKKIVDEICRKAGLFNQSSRSDDVTVIGVKARRSRGGGRLV